MNNFTKLIKSLLTVIVFIYSIGASAQVDSNVIMTWVPGYGIPNSKTIAEADRGDCDPKDVITRVGLQFWDINSNGTIKYNSYNPDDADVNWFLNWGQTNDIEILLTIYNNNGTNWDWTKAVTAFRDNRNTLVNSLVLEVERLGLDGVDIDFEAEGDLGYDLNNDRAAFSQFVSQLSSELKSRGKLLTINSFAYIWGAPNITWWSDWSGYIDTVTVMGYSFLHEGSSTNYENYSFHQNNSVSDGLGHKGVNMGIAGWLNSWGTPGAGRGLTVQDHIQEIRYDLPHGSTGISIWDMQVPAWGDDIATWCEIAGLRGTPNSNPIASFTETVNNLTVDFTDTSTDNDGSIVSWSWNFGDGNTSTIQNPTHSYTVDGTYNISLTVTDDLGATNMIAKLVNACLDSDGDSICDSDDICPGFDDNVDSDGDGIPDGCDSHCSSSSVSFLPNPLTHIGSGSSNTSASLPLNAENISFTINDINSKTNGKPSVRFIELVTITYVDQNGNTQQAGSFSGVNTSTETITIPNFAQSISVTLQDGYDGNTNTQISINLSAVSYCISSSNSSLSNKALHRTEVNDETSQVLLKNQVRMYPNPTSGILNIDFKSGEELPRKVSIYNIEGRLVSIKSINSGKVDISELRQGIYLFVLDSKLGRINKLIILK